MDWKFLDRYNYTLSAPAQLQLEEVYGLINLLPRRALVAGMCERLLDHPTRGMFLQELSDSFHDLQWLAAWSPRWRSEFGSEAAA